MDFVVGHPRSGTTLIAELLNAGGETVCAHEHLAALTPDGISAPTEFYLGRRDAAAIARLLDRYRETPAIRIDSNWKLAWILPVVRERFPDARILHLVRDPRENVRSCVDLDFYGSLRFAPPFSEDHGRNAWLEWMPPLQRDDWSALSQLERNCAFWTESHRLILEGLRGHERVERVRLEDLTSGVDTARRVLAFFGVTPPPADRLAQLLATRRNERLPMKARVAAARPPLGPFAQWAEDAQRTLLRLCGDRALELGYSLRQASKPR